MTTEIILAGFGGQGILFAGKVLAYCALIDGKEISWLPSYGPEMRGGTANCSVCISDEPIGSPVVANPDCLIAMNEPSYRKFIGAVKPGGLAFVDGSMVSAKCERTDITFVSVSAVDLASEVGADGMENMVLLGRMLAQTHLFSFDTVRKALEKCIPAKRAHLIEANLAALKCGMNTFDGKQPGA